MVIETEAAKFPEKEYINGIFVAVRSLKTRYEVENRRKKPNIIQYFRILFVWKFLTTMFTIVYIKLIQNRTLKNNSTTNFAVGRRGYFRNTADKKIPLVVFTVHCTTIFTEKLATSKFQL
jgi:hypothetical protein